MKKETIIAPDFSGGESPQRNSVSTLNLWTNEQV